MAVYDAFTKFCGNLAISRDLRSTIADRYGLITQRLNADFRKLDSKNAYSFYNGSYGRMTAITGFSDLDMIYELPYELKIQYDRHAGNGQSALLQAVRNSIKRTYPSTEIGADGQVVIVSFSDGITFEVVPAFLSSYNSTYIFPDSNDGGSWRSTNPKPEIAEIGRKDTLLNGNLRALSKMTRAWKREKNVPIGGLLIDTLAYNFLNDYNYANNSAVYYDWMVRDFFKYLSNCDKQQKYWLALGSNQQVYRTGQFEWKALVAYNIACEACEYYAKEYYWSGSEEMKKIFGSIFTA